MTTSKPFASKLTLNNSPAITYKTVILFFLAALFSLLGIALIVILIQGDDSFLSKRILNPFPNTQNENSVEQNDLNIESLNPNTQDNQSQEAKIQEDSSTIQSTLNDLDQGLKDVSIDVEYLEESPQKNDKPPTL